VSLSPDLVLRPGPGAPGGLTIPASDLEETFSRSSGPGGQSVNTTDSRVELALDLTTCSALTDAQRERAIGRLGGRIAVTASEHRSQHRNRVAARHRLAERLRAKPTKGSQRRRIEGKKRRAQVKSMRGRVSRTD
jgi:ribosome-associated protein